MPSAAIWQPGLGLLKGLVIMTGFVIILLAVATHLWRLDLNQTFTWLDAAFGPVFIAIYLLLVALAIYATTNLPRTDGGMWFELGSQAAAGIATLALTFTLLGISLGIESLSRHELSPETVQAVIGDLTRHFSTAFLTTIVGLPTANLLRATLAVRWATMGGNDGPIPNRRRDL